MDLSDERFHRRRVPWRTLTKDGYEPQKVMLAAQKKVTGNQRRDQV